MRQMISSISERFKGMMNTGRNANACSELNINKTITPNACGIIQMLNRAGITLAVALSAAHLTSGMTTFTTDAIAAALCSHSQYFLVLILIVLAAWVVSGGVRK